MEKESTNVTQVDPVQNSNPNSIIQQPQPQLDPNLYSSSYPPFYAYTTTNATLIDPNQNPNSSTLGSYYTYYPSHLQNPNVQYYADPNAHVAPPGVAEQYPSATVSSYPHAQTVVYGQPGPNDYFVDPNSQHWAAKEAVRIYGTDPAAASYGPSVNITLPPNGTQQLAVTHPCSTIRSNQSLPRNGSRNNRPKKTKIKVVQSAFCEVCKVDCNTKDILEQHKAGKKHKKNVEKLEKAAAATSSSTSVAGTSNPVIGPQENPESIDNQLSKKRTAESLEQSETKRRKAQEDLETKRMKMVQGGAAADAVKTCTLCNVVCNSGTVYAFHLAGIKHKKNAIQNAAKIAVPNAT